MGEMPCMSATSRQGRVNHCFVTLHISTHTHTQRHKHTHTDRHTDRHRHAVTYSWCTQQQVFITFNRRLAQSTLNTVQRLEPFKRCLCVLRQLVNCYQRLHPAKLHRFHILANNSTSTSAISTTEILSRIGLSNFASDGQLVN